MPSAAPTKCRYRSLAMRADDRTKRSFPSYSANGRVFMSDRVAGKPNNTLINAGILLALISAFALAGFAMAPAKPQGMTVIATVKKT
jgi:hypothetical protein